MGTVISLLASFIVGLVLPVLFIILLGYALTKVFKDEE